MGKVVAGTRVDRSHSATSVKSKRMNLPTRKDATLLSATWAGSSPGTGRGPGPEGGSPWTRWCRQGGSVSSSRPTGMASRGSTASPTCVLQALRDRLRCKEIWVQGADRWRNPDDDLPKDFEASLAQHYQRLGQPLDPTEFVERLRHERLERALGGRCPPWPHPPTNEDLVPADSATTMSRCGPCGGRKPT